MGLPTAKNLTDAQNLTTSRALRILHLEDNPDDRTLIQHWIAKHNVTAEFTDVAMEGDFIGALEHHDFDLIFADQRLPGYDGSLALRYVREKHPHLPFIFVTGSIGEDAAIETMKQGATDYVLKERLNRLIPAMKRALAEAVREERNRTNERKLQQQAALLDKAQDAILVKDMDDRIIYWNKSAERMYGWTAGEVIGKKAAEVLNRDEARYLEAQERMTEAGSWEGDLVKVNRGGNELIVDSHWTLVRDDDGEPARVFVIDTDITQKKSIEAKFLRSQRLDSIGTLASGIAHDLNNALAPVLMGAELLAQCEDFSEREKYLDIISSNTRRATGLVKQILSFARGTGNRHEPIQLASLLQEVRNMILETFPKSILSVVRTPEKGLWTVQGDTTEIHQVLLNLCVNARDAMPDGGHLTLTAENFVQSPEAAAAVGTKPGPYIMISVADTGSGIPPGVLPRIFEPFYTTKAEKGTGLGLFTVSTIIKQHGGFMDLQTEAGKGTEFKVYLPVARGAKAMKPEISVPPPPSGHGELILVMDDEETLLELTRTMLEGFGYKVTTARNGLDGIARFKENQNRIKLIITDGDMPYLNGPDAIRIIRESAPKLPVILASGTTFDTEAIRRSVSAPVKRLGKPYSLEQLLEAAAAAIHD